MFYYILQHGLKHKSLVFEADLHSYVLSIAYLSCSLEGRLCVMSSGSVGCVYCAEYGCKYEKQFILIKSRMRFENFKIKSYLKLKRMRIILLKFCLGKRNLKSLFLSISEKIRKKESFINSSYEFMRGPQRGNLVSEKSSIYCKCQPSYLLSDAETCVVGP